MRAPNGPSGLLLIVSAIALTCLGTPAAANPLPTARMAVSRAVATENSVQPVRITVELDQPAPDTGLDIVLDVAGGSATPGVDFQPPQGLHIPAGMTAGDTQLTIIDDRVHEQDEVVRIALRPGNGYQVGDPNSFDLLIRDDDETQEDLADRLRQLIANSPDPLVASQLESLARLCATSTPAQGSELDRRCQLLRLALLDPNAAGNLIGSLRGALGEELSSQRRGFRMLAVGQLGAINRRLEAVRGGAGAGVALSGLELQSNLGFMPMDAEVAGDGELLGRGIGLFLTGTISTGKRDATDLEDGYDSDADTLLIGVDKRFGPNWVVGLTYTRSSFDADLDDDAGTLALDQNAFGVYASYSRDRLWLDGSFGVGHGKVRSERVANFSASSEEETLETSDVLVGRPDTDVRYATLSSGFDWNHGRYTFGPRLALEYARLDIDGFEEVATEGEDAFAVGLEKQRVRSLLARTGAGATAAFSTSWGVLQPQIDAAWVVQLEDQDQALHGYFVNDPQQSLFTLPTSSVDTHYGELSLGLTAVFANGNSGFVSWRRLFALDDTEQQFWSFGFRAEF